MATLRASAVLLLASSALAGMYEPSDGIVMLDDSNYSQLTRDSQGIWLVEAFAEWCGHCKAFAPEYKKAARALAGIVKVAALEGDKAQSSSSRLGVKGFPTVRLFTGDKTGQGTEYQGPRDAKSLVDWVLKEVASTARARLGGKASSGGSSGGAKAGAKGGSGGGKGDSAPGGGKAVVTGTEENFDDEVINASEPVFVEFYAPWCGHCKSLAPAWAQAAEELEGEVKFVAVDATVHGSLAQRFGVQGYPTIKQFPGGKKTYSSAQDYNGGRDARELVAAARNLLDATGGSKGVVTQLTGAAVWDEQCGSKRLCIVAVLPSILDDGAAKRNRRLEALTTAAGKVGKKHLVRFLWTEVGAQPVLEEILNVGMTPALFAVAAEKKMSQQHRGPVDADGTTKFVQSVMTRADGASPFPAGKELKIVEAVAWDGKDGVLPESSEPEL